jgi:small-conductance mechanosensitive channel
LAEVLASLWLQPWFWPTVAVIVGLPLTLLALTEIHTMLERRGSRGTRIIMLLRNYVAPVGALLLLLNQATYADLPLTWTQIAATAFGFLLILVLFNTLNFALFVTARQGSWRSRVPSIFIDIVRILLIVVCLAVLFAFVWGADIGGLFAALGVGSIVIGLALQNPIGSIVTGLLLLFEQPFQLGDWVVINGVRGRIVDVNWRATHLKTSSGVHIMPNAMIADSMFMNISRNDSPFEMETVVKFATDDPPQLVIDVCRRVAADLPAAVPGEQAMIVPMLKAKYEVAVPIASPADNYRSTIIFRTRLWYAARRAGLHLDGDLTDPFNTPENTVNALRSVAPALYLTEEDIGVLVPQVRLERYGEGEVVQYAHVVPEGMRFILSGMATIATPVDVGAEVRFAVLDTGDMLGLSALTRQGVAAKVVAATDLAVLFVPVAVLDGLVKSRPRLARDIGVEMDNRRGMAVKALEAAGVEVPSGWRLIA